MYKKEFDDFGNILQIDNFQQVCLDEYDAYLDTIIEFKGTKEDMQSIYQKYKNYLLKMVLSTDELKDKIMIEEKRTIRHDKEFEKSVNMPMVSENIFQRTGDLNHFEERARTIILLEIAKLINFYGMEELDKNQDRISKEIRLGIFSARTDRYLPKTELEKIEQRISLDETFGEESIPYIENYDLLKERILSLREFTKVPEEMQQLDILIQQLNSIHTMLEQKDKGMLPLLKQCYSDYEKINRTILLSRLNVSDEGVIDNPNDESLLLLHFIPDFGEKSDITQDEFFDSAVDDSIKAFIESKYGRKFDPELDSEEASDMLLDYMDSRKNPFDLSSRIPLKNRYTNTSFNYVVTAPHTNLSCSISKIGALHSHLNRKIAIGFSHVPINAIKSINRGYNNALDRFSFERNSVAIPEVLEHIESGGTNETLVDWTQIEPAYIMVVKDTAELSEELLMQVEEYSNTTGLPIRIYDAYEIEKRKKNPELNNENQEIEGAYSATDLAAFTQIKSKDNLLQKIKGILANKELGGTQNEHNI